jgi:molybdenum cofactor cytidylyltransferase
MKVVGILLAAGFSTRFGTNKLLAPLPAGTPEAGTPVAVAAARHLAEALPESVAVVRPRAQKVSQLLREAGCRTVICKNAAQGMGASLAAGVRAADDADGWVIALADMPFVGPETIRRIATALEEGAAIAAPACGGERGHPVGFARRFRDELLALTGDEGARQILKAHPDWITLYETGDRGVLRDVDVPADLAGRTDNA